MKIARTLTAAAVSFASWQAGILACSASDAQEASANATNPLTADPDLAIFTFIIFILLLVVLYVLAWKPLMAGLDQRESSIAQLIDEAKLNNEQAEERLQQYEQKLATAAQEAQEYMEKAKRDAQATGEALIADARAEADRERQRAVNDITLAKNSALQEIASQSTDLAFSLARKMIQKEQKPEDHAALIRESLDQFPSEN